MNKLQKAAGLLNDKAPENHFLAYINPKEAGLLKLAGGSGKMTPQGILSFEDDDPGDTFSGSSNDNSGSSYDEAGVDSYTNNSYSGGSPAYSGGGYNETTTTTTDDSQDDDKALSYVNWNEPVTSPENVSEDSNVSLLSNLFKVAKVPYDLLQGNIPTSLLSLINPFKFSQEENQYAGITGEDGYGEGDYVSTLDDWAEQEGFGKYDTLDNETQQYVDQVAFDGGYRSQDFKDFYSGENTSTVNFSQPESEVYNKLIPYAPFIASGTEAPQQSMVNDYFANLGSQTSLSSQLETDYNAAKASVAQAMAMNPLANQFGYSQTPYGGLTATNLDTNPFNIPYLQTRGLI